MDNQFIFRTVPNTENLINAFSFSARPREKKERQEYDWCLARVEMDKKSKTFYCGLFIYDPNNQ